RVPLPDVTAHGVCLLPLTCCTMPHGGLVWPQPESLRRFSNSKEFALSLLPHRIYSGTLRFHGGDQRGPWRRKARTEEKPTDHTEPPPMLDSLKSIQPRSRRLKVRHRRDLRVEELEARSLLTAYAPSQIAHAYGIDKLPYD